MFTIAVTFVVFVGSIFFLQGASIESNIRVAFGADIVVCAALHPAPRACELKQLTPLQVRAVAEQRVQRSEPAQSRLFERDRS